VGPRGMPAVQPSQWWISSIPPGLEIYVAPIEVAPNVGKAGGGWVATEPKHPAVTPKYRLGKTPVLLENVAVADYLVALVQPVNRAQEVRAEGVKTVAWVKDGADIDEKWMKRYAANQLKETFPIVYAVSKELVGQGATILSAVNWDGPDQPIHAAYPKEKNFEFDEVRLRSELAAEAVTRGATVEETDTAMGLLHRGGLAVLRNPSLRARVWIHLLPGGRWKTTPQLDLASVKNSTR
jgi:hypothetical protein